MAFDMFSKIPMDKLIMIMAKYGAADIKNVKTSIELYDNAAIMKIITDSEQVGNMIAELLPILGSLIGGENIKVVDNRN